MRAALALLVAGLALAAPAAAQLPGASKPALEADAHIFSAFTSRADPGVLAGNVRLGPALRKQLGADADGRRVYEALVERIGSQPLNSRSLSIAEARGHASLGVNSADPLVLVEAGDIRLLMQYSTPQKNVTFVEQLSGPAAPKPRSETPSPVPEASTPAPIVEVPLPTAPLAAPAFVPAPAAPAPAPQPRAPVATVAPTPKPSAPPTAEPRRAAPKPRGECVIKPVMSEDELWNCSAPGQASSPQIAVPAPVATQAPAPQPAEQPRAECVIKPVMSEQDLRNCAAASRSRPAAAMEVAAPVVAAQPPAPAPQLQAAPQPPECVIKPVMSEQDLRICAAASRSRPAAAVESSAPVVAAPAAAAMPALQAAPQPAECVIKPVMSEEDLRICAAASKGRPMPAMETAAPRPVAAQPAPAATPAPRDCVIKPVMSEEDLRACGVRR